MKFFYPKAFLSGTGGSSSSGTGGDLTAFYVLTQSDSNLANGKIISPGTGITVSVVGDQVFVSATGSGGGGGGVVSVGMVVPTEFSVSPSTITSSGTFTISKQNQGSNQVYSAPANGSTGQPAFRNLVGQDLLSAFAASSNLYMEIDGNLLVISCTGLPAKAGAGIQITGNVISAYASGTYQPLNNNLTALAGLSGTGYLVQTGAGTFVERVFQGTAGRVTVSQPDGVSGNTQVDIGSTVFTTQNTSTIFNTLASSTASQDRTALGTPSVTDSFIVVGSVPAELTNGRQVIGGAGIQVIDNGAGNTLAILSSGAQGGTVTSVNVTVPGYLGVNGVPITNSGTAAIFSKSAVLENLSSGNVGNGLSISGGILNSTTYSAGPGIQLSGTTFSNYTSGAAISSGNLNPLFNSSILGNVLTFTQQTAAASSLYGNGTGVNPSFISVLPGANITLSWTATSLTINGNSGTVTSVGLALPSDIFSVSGSPVTNTGTLTGSTLSHSASTFWASDPVLGGIPWFRNIVGADLGLALHAGANTTLTLSGSSLIIASTASGGGGTVTTFGAGTLSPLFTTSVGSPTTTPSLSFTLSNAACGTLFGVGDPGALTGAPSYLSVLPGTNVILNWTATGVTVNSSNPGGTVTSIGMTVPQFLAVNPSSITTSGTFAITSTSNTLNFLASAIPTNGQIPIGNGVNYTLAVPTAGPGIQIIPGAGSLTVSSYASGAVESVGSLNPLFTSTLGGNSLTFALQTAAASSFYGTGINTTPSFIALLAGNNVTLGWTATGVSINGNAGTVTSIGMTVPPWLGVTPASITSSGTFAVTSTSHILDALASANPTNGQLLIGNSGAFSLAGLTAGAGIQILTGPGTITVANYASGAILSSGNLSTWFNTSVVNQSLTFSPTGAKGDIPYYSNTNTAANLTVGQTSQAVVVAAGLPTYGNLLYGFASATTNKSLTITDFSYQNIDASAASVTLTLGAASSMPNKIFWFKNDTITGTNTCTVQTNGTDTVEGIVTSVTVPKLQAWGVISDGVNTYRYLKPRIESPAAGGTGSGTLPTDGQIPIGSTSAGIYSPTLITAGSGIQIVFGANTITISATGAGGGGGSGTVTSVGLSTDNVIYATPATNSPITTSGTLALALKTQIDNVTLIGPVSGSAAAPTFRLISGADLASGIIAGTNVTLTQVNTGPLGGQLQINAAGTNAKTWSNLTTTASGSAGFVGYTADVSGGSFSFYFPSSASAGNQIWIKLKAVGSPANTLTIVPYTTIDGSGSSLTSNRVNDAWMFEYDGAAWWQFI